MKKTLCVLAALALATTGFAQKSGGTARTVATMNLENYRVDLKNKQELKNAIENIEIAAKDEKTGADGRTWRLRGEIYALAGADDQLRIQDAYKKASGVAFDSYEKALQLETDKATAKGKPASKIAAKPEFYNGFELTARALYTQGSLAFNDADYSRAYELFGKLLKIRPLTAGFAENKPVKLTFGEEQIDMESNAAYLGGMAAVNLKKIGEAEKMLKPIIDAKKIKEDDIKRVYSLLASAYFQEGKIADSKRVLEEGRKKFPTDYGLLITEINIALSEGRLGELEQELTLAVKADPDNVELHFVMGNMYDELFRNKINPEKSDISETDYKDGKSFFDKAVDWYQKAAKLDAKHFNSLYSLGAIHVNYSNYFATKIQKSEKMNDKDRKALEQEYDKYVDLGLKHLLVAEKVNGEDIGLIRALKEVYTRKSDDDNWAKYNAKEKELIKKMNEK